MSFLSGTFFSALVLAHLMSTSICGAEERRAWQLFQVVGSHQDSTSTVIVHPDGNIMFLSRFSNGHRTDGDHFVAEVVGRDSGGKPLFAGSQGAGVNASFGGRTRVVSVHQTLKVTANEIAAISYVEARHYQKDTKGEIGFLIEYHDKDGDGVAEWDWGHIVDPVKNTVPGPFLKMNVIPPPKPKPVAVGPRCPEAYNDAGKVVSECF